MAIKEEIGYFSVIGQNQENITTKKKWMIGQKEAF